MRLWTIGHSTRSIEEFIGLLSKSGARLAVDVRAFPGSRRHPHFGMASLAKSLPAAGIEYLWMGEELGGRRRASPVESPNPGLRNASFRNYADYMLTSEFRAGVDRLLALAGEKETAFFCSEAVWWRCHRSLIADYLVAVRGVEVLDVIDEHEPKPHVPKPEARREGERLFYEGVDKA